MIVGVSGKMQSGKDTVANMWHYFVAKGNGWLGDFNEKLTYSTLSSWETKKFAEGVKKVASILTGIPLEELEQDGAKQIVLPKCWNTVISEDDEITLTKVMTVRELFQKIGTDAIRNNVHPDAWVNSLLSEYAPGDNWIISDVRFPNEARAIKKHRGILIRVVRSDIPQNDHLSETALDDYNIWDYVINNNGDINKLLLNVNKIYNNLVGASRL